MTPFERFPIQPRDLTTESGMEALELARVAADACDKLDAERARMERMRVLVDGWEAQLEWMDEPQAGVLRLCVAEARAIIGEAS